MNTSVTYGEMANLQNATSNITIQMNDSQLDKCAADNSTEVDVSLQTTTTVVIEILMPILVVYGILGNIVNITVLTRRWMYSSTNCYLTALAIYDMMYLIVVPSLSLEHMSVFKGLIGFTYQQYAAYARPIADVFSNTAVWLTVVFTVERYIAVCHPIRGHILCTPQRARWVILVTCLLVFAILIPEFFEYKAVKGPCFAELDQTDFAKATPYSFGYNWGVIVFLFTIVPLILVSIFNTFLVLSVWRASQMRHELSNSNAHDERRNRDQRRITIMLIAVVIAFFCLHTPNAGALLYLSYKRSSSNWEPTTQEYSNLRKMFMSVNFLALINSTINFVLYSMLSTKFRKTFKRVFLPCCAKNASLHFTMASFHRTQRNEGKNKTADHESQLINRKHNSNTNALKKNGNSCTAKLTDSESSTQETVDYLSSV